MNRIKFYLKDERGFLMLNVIFLTLITSFAAMILLNAAPRIKTPQSTLRLTALYLAEEQFAQLESLAASGEPLKEDFLGKEEDLITKNFYEENSIRFEVTTNIDSDEGLHKVTVTVKWTVGGKNFDVKSERLIWFVEKEELP